MKKIILIALSMALILTLVGCTGGNSAPTPAAATGTPSVQPTEVKDVPKNTLVIADSSNYTGAEYEPAINNDEDGTFIYTTLLDNGELRIVNQSFANLDGEDMNEYINACVKKIAGDAAPYEIQIETSDKYTAVFTHPTYKATWLTGANEDTRRAVALIFKTENYTLAYTCDTSADRFDETEDLINNSFEHLTLHDTADDITG